MDSIHGGLRDLEHIRREVDAATALLVAALPENRDSVTSLARESGVSTREARRRRDVAAVVAAIPLAGELLAGGALSAEHFAALIPMIGDAAAAAFATGAVDQSPEEVVRAVRQHRLDLEHGADTTRRQRAMRSLRFFGGPEGMIGLHGLLPRSRAPRSSRCSRRSSTGTGSPSIPIEHRCSVATAGTPTNN